MSNWEKGSTSAWRKIRALVLARDGHICQLRLPGCTRTATHAHHTRGRAATGDDIRFIVASCEHCNLKVGDPTEHDPPAQPHSNWR